MVPVLSTDGELRTTNASKDLLSSYADPMNGFHVVFKMLQVCCKPTPCSEDEQDQCKPYAVPLGGEGRDVTGPAKVQQE